MPAFSVEEAVAVLPWDSRLPAACAVPVVVLTRPPIARASHGGHGDGRSAPSDVAQEQGQESHVHLHGVWCLVSPRSLARPGVGASAIGGVTRTHRAVNTAGERSPGSLWEGLITVNPSGTGGPQDVPRPRSPAPPRSRRPGRPGHTDHFRTARAEPPVRCRTRTPVRPYGEHPVTADEILEYDDVTTSSPAVTVGVDFGTLSGPCRGRHRRGRHRARQRCPRVPARRGRPRAARDRSPAATGLGAADARRLA